ncbi:MAG: hypothetical protein PHE27_03020 [Alphaproteobacteria bacterium]|nr:hypothetical protein [Alphaproteobacteria bacterium]
MKLFLQSRSVVASFAALGALLLSSVPAHADIQAIREANTALWASIGGDFLNYKEPVSPIPDSEHGWLPSIAGGLSYMGKTSNTFLDIEASVSFGDEDYKGAYMNFPTVPLSGTTHSVITQVDAKVGQGFELGDSVMVTPYVDFGYRYWERDVTGTFLERYQHFELLGGAMLQASLTRNLIFTAYGAAGGTFSPTMESAYGDFDLGSSGVFKAGGKLGYTMTRNWELFTSVDVNHFRYFKSNVIYYGADGYYEPTSSTTETAIRLGVSYHLR